ncbi:MAG: hypothetical protein ACREPM_07310 [Gemmatimonadaceae bacterium]
MIRRLAAAATLVAAARLSAQADALSLTAPGPLVISTATAGGQPVAQTDQTARYSVTAGSGRLKITGYVDSPLPSGVTLTITLAAPTGAASAGPVVLTTTAKDLVRYIEVGQYNSLTVTLTLSANVTAGVVPYAPKGVVLTLATDP